MSELNTFSIMKQILNGEEIPRDSYIYLAENEDLYTLMYGANLLRQQFKKNEVDLCSLINAKSGNCSENCKFCAQSASNDAEAPVYSLVSEKDILSAYKEAAEAGTRRFDIVTSGNTLSEKDFESILSAIRKIKKDSINDVSICCSIGSLSTEQAKALKEAGVTRAHHNIETSQNNFSNICSSHKYEDRLQTIHAIKDAGLEVCTGGIFGMGESWEDRIDMAIELKKLDVDAIPMNFLVPIKGTKFENQAPLSPLEILRIISIFRFILPDKDIRICGGREIHLKDLQSWVFFAGANAIMIGGYLTIKGRQVADDIQMIKDLGLTIRE